jgi:hypothetical protein
MKLVRIYILRAITPSGESTSLGNLPPYPTEAKALEAVTSGEVTLPNGCYAQAVAAYAVAEEETTEASAAPAKKATAPKAKAKAKETPPVPPVGEDNKE